MCEYGYKSGNVLGRILSRSYFFVANSVDPSLEGASFNPSTNPRASLFSGLQ